MTERHNIQKLLPVVRFGHRVMFITPHSILVPRPFLEHSRKSFKKPWKPCILQRQLAPHHMIAQSNPPTKPDSQNNDDTSLEDNPLADDSLCDSNSTPSNRQLDDVEILEQRWIGSNISRWETYERIKQNRQQLEDIASENQQRFAEDMMLLKQNLRNLEGSLGPGLLDDQSNISLLGWSVIMLIVSPYILIGYSIVRALVNAIVQISSSQNFL